MLEIDCSEGEGGGQILRSALSLSMVTGQAIRLARIRATRGKPGLRLQHLAAVRAAASLCGAEVRGDALDSQDLEFRPGPVAAGDIRVAIGTAGSTTLVIQTLLPPLMLASEPSRLSVEGGTHNPLSPPFEFLGRAFLPLVAALGPGVSARLLAPGFYPKGGGNIEVTVAPVAAARPLVLLERGEPVARRARALVSRLPAHIGERQLELVRRRLGWSRDELRLDLDATSPGPGNALMLELEYPRHRELFTGFGQRGLAAESVAYQALAEAQAYLAARAPVGEYLADQLLLPMSLLAGGAFRATRISSHTRSNIQVISRFLGENIRFADQGEEGWLVEIRGLKP